MMIKSACLFLALLLLSGCRGDVLELEKKVLERDPSFQSVIDEKDAMSKELDETKKDYFKKKHGMEGQIAAIRQELEKTRGEYASRVERIKKKLDPEITEMKNGVKILKLEVTVRNAELRGVEKSIKEIKELVQKGQSLEMTQEEMRMWNERMTSLLNKREAIVKDRDKTVADIETSEFKVRILTER